MAFEINDLSLLAALVVLSVGGTFAILYLIKFFGEKSKRKYTKLSKDMVAEADFFSTAGAFLACSKSAVLAV
ncbi:MAG: hypothetical protein DA330_08380 [Nitrososphaera sp.]|nr:hypothetical protein [Nitrososphaera sp.]